VSKAVAKIFNTHEKDCINQIRLACDSLAVSVMTERLRMKFVNNMLDSDHLRCFLCKLLMFLIVCFYLF